jgi:hypothetical protein
MSSEDVQMIRDYLMRLAHDAGVPVVESIAAIGDVAPTSPRHLALLEPSEFTRLDRLAGTWAPGMVWATVGAVSPEIVNQIGGALQASAFCFTQQQLQQAPPERGLGAILRETLSDGGAEKGPILLLGTDAEWASLEMAAQVHLEATGRVVRSLGAPHLLTSERLLGIYGDQAVVVRIDLGWTTQPGLDAARVALERLKVAGVPVILVGARSVEAQVRADDAWADLLAEATVWYSPASRAAVVRAEQSVAWPQLTHMLPGAPQVVPTGPLLMQSRVGASGEGVVPLHVALQSVLDDQADKLVLVYRHDRLGIIQTARGAIVDVRILGDPWTLSALDPGRERPAQELILRVLEERFYRMVLWPAADVVVLGDPPPVMQPVRLTTTKLPFESARRLDEMAIEGGPMLPWREVWMARSLEAPPEVAARAHMRALWQFCDGRRTILEAAIAAHLLPGEALHAYRALRANDHMQLVRDELDTRGPDTTDVDSVASELLRRGLLRAARDVLYAREQEEPLGRWGAYTLGYLMAEEQPSQALALWSSLPQRAMFRPQDDLAPQALIDVRFAQGLVEVRQPGANALMTWTSTRADLVRFGRFTWTARHYATAVEMATRAGDATSVTTALEGLEALPADQTAHLLPALLSAMR